MTSLDLQVIERRAEHFVSKGDPTSIRWFYTHDVPELLAEIERLKEERNKALWRVECPA